MIMKKKTITSHRLEVQAVLLSFICSCQTAHSPFTSPEADSTLIIDKVEVSATKAPYTAPVLKGELGIMLVDDSGKDSYDGKEYLNVRFTAEGDGICRPEREVLLSTTEARLYSYYPYSGTITDLRNIPIDLSSDASTDHMYGTPVTDLNNLNPNAAITMNHALAAINISLIKGKYSGPGVVTDISVYGKGIARKAILDATTGILRDFTDIAAEIRIPTDFRLQSGTAQNNYLIVIPTGESSPFTIKVTIDGMEFFTTAAATDLPTGTITGYTVIVNSETMEIAKGTVTQWYSEYCGNREVSIY